MKWLRKIKDTDRMKRIAKWPVWRRYSGPEWTLLVFGALLIFYLLINIFTSLGDKTPPPHMLRPVTFRNIGAFEGTLASTLDSAVEELGTIEILTNGAEFLPDLLSEIARAEQKIYITNYIWDDGEFGNTIFTALIEKQKDGVEVRVLLDGIGGRTANEKLIEELRRHGGKVAYFRPVKWWNISRINRRSHVRDIVIDGRVAYYGGIAISDSWLGNADTPDSWHDYMFKMDKAAAIRGERIFASLWGQATGEILAASEPRADAETEPSSHFVSFLSAPSPDMSHHMEYFIWLSVQAAEESIYIENPYLLPSESIRKALKNKAREGVDIRIIAPSDKTDAKYVRWASQSFYTELLEAGVRIFEYEPARTHAKIMVMDGVWSIIGSANLDNRSRKINLEAVLGIGDREFARELEMEFLKDVENSKEITKEGWGRGPILMKPLQLVSRLFIEQY